MKPRSSCPAMPSCFSILHTMSSTTCQASSVIEPRNEACTWSRRNNSSSDSTSEARCGQMQRPVAQSPPTAWWRRRARLWSTELGTTHARHWWHECPKRDEDSEKRRRNIAAHRRPRAGPRRLQLTECRGKHVRRRTRSTESASEQRLVPIAHLVVSPSENTNRLI
jgi:hypothetical protein